MQSFRTFIKDVHNERLLNFLSGLSSPSEKVQVYDLKDLSEATVISLTNRPKVKAPEPEAHKNAGPMTLASIHKGNEAIPEGTNVHKQIHAGFRKAFTEMAHETPKESRAKLSESHRVLHTFVKNYGWKHRPELLSENGKTKKSTGEGVHTKGLALAPHTTNGLKDFDVCPRSSSDCRKNCLGTEAGGNKQYPDSSLNSKVVRTHFLAIHPEHAARILDHEIGNHVKRAKANGYKPGFRLNITSDLSWEHHAPELFEKHKDAQFYDYTKMPNRVGHPDLPKNYHLTLSHTGTGHKESNDKQVAKHLAAGHVVAMVHNGGRGGNPIPTHVEDVKSGKRYPLINGDHDDNTFDRHAQAHKTPDKPGHGVVSGLKLKGVSEARAGNFVNKVDADGIIRINK